MVAGTTQSGHSKPVLYISPPGPLVGDTNCVPYSRRLLPKLFLGEGAIIGQVKGGRFGGNLHIWFRCDVITLDSHQKHEILCVFIGITLPLSVHKMNI